jgi:hypothetical protein
LSTSQTKVFTINNFATNNIIKVKNRNITSKFSNFNNKKVIENRYNRHNNKIAAIKDNNNRCIKDKIEKKKLDL